MLTTLAIQGYRSLREVIVPLDQLTVVTGPNGVGKSNLYRAVQLLAHTAHGQLIQTLAAEGGLASTMWAGPEHISAAMRNETAAVEGTRRSGPLRLQLGVAGHDLGYCVDVGLPHPADAGTYFTHDPEIKAETVWAGPVARPAAHLVRRCGPAVTSRTDTGWTSLSTSLATFDSCVSSLADPRRAPELLDLRESMRQWRFYDHLRADAGSPARRPTVATRTPVLASDGNDLAAALATILESGRAGPLLDLISQAFDGATLDISETSGLLGISLCHPGMLRPLRADELSDGTLRYLLLAAALCTPRPPGFMVLNEPETSLHPDLLQPLADLMITASQHIQIMVITHSPVLQRALGGQHLLLIKEMGETVVADQGTLDRPAWTWPARN